MNVTPEHMRCDAQQGRRYCAGRGNGGDPQPWHVCPYASEINDDDTTMCTCCVACERECCDDI
jgi:hypothetical protein